MFKNILLVPNVHAIVFPITEGVQQNFLCHKLSAMTVAFREKIVKWEKSFKELETAMLAVNTHCLSIIHVKQIIEQWVYR